MVASLFLLIFFALVNRLVDFRLSRNDVKEDLC